LDIILDNIGLPYSGLSLAQRSATLGSLDGEILVFAQAKIITAQNYVETAQQAENQGPDMIFSTSPPTS